MFTNIRFQCPLVESFNQPVTKFAFEKMERAQIVGGFLLEGELKVVYATFRALIYQQTTMSYVKT